MDMEKDRRDIRKFPDPVLREKTEPVDEINGDIIRIIKRMRNIMHKAKGIGLAANQIGINKSILVAEVEDFKVSIINPLIIESSGEDIMEEGCLSVPNTYIEITRPTGIVIKGLDEEENEIEQEYNGLIARVIQHEIDHLQGTLIVDYLSPSEFLRFQMEYEKMLKSEEK